MELRETHPGIKVSLVMPGPVSTEFAANVIGLPPGSPPQIAKNVHYQTAEEVATCIVDVIDKPVPEVYTNPTHKEFAARYYQDVGAFEDHFAEQRRP